jgi:hypothetical protein
LCSVSPGRPPAARIERAVTFAHVDVARGVADHGRLAGRAARRMHAHDLLARHREQAERVVVAQVALGRERELREIGERVQVVRVHARRVERPAIVCNVVVRVAQRPLRRSSCSACSSSRLAVSIGSSAAAGCVG